MPSTLTWIDYDSEARERSLKILALFKQKEGRDELGLGSIRDSFADQFFPGTSTIQTRLRYMLFVPWIYQKLESEHITGKEFAAKADRIERDLIAPLLDSEDVAGIFGRTVGRGVKRLPSEVYWSGLGSWGIRLFDASRDVYHRNIDAVYRKRANMSARLKDRAGRGDDTDEYAFQGTDTWHKRLPKPPSGFPEKAKLALTTEEAEYLLDRIKESHPNSLLSHLALNCKHADVDMPWEHPDFSGFSEDHKNLLEYARIFSEVMHGAALLYNIMLSELAYLKDLREEYNRRFNDWCGLINISELRSWSLNNLWSLTEGHGHNITPQTETFVKRWVELASQKPKEILNNSVARELIRNRERSIKNNGRSRFENRRALDQWRGESGTRRLVYRWPTTKTLLLDLHDGLRGDAS